MGYGKKKAPEPGLPKPNTQLATISEIIKEQSDKVVQGLEDLRILGISIVQKMGNAFNTIDTEPLEEKKDFEGNTYFESPVERAMRKIQGGKAVSDVICNYGKAKFFNTAPITQNSDTEIIIRTEK